MRIVICSLKLSLNTSAVMINGKNFLKMFSFPLVKVAYHLVNNCYYSFKVKENIINHMQLKKSFNYNITLTLTEYSHLCTIFYLQTL